MNYLLFVSIAVALMGGLHDCAAEDKFEIGVSVLGAEPHVGQVLFSLFGSSKTYLKEPLAEANADVENGGRAFVSFGEWAPGEYAIIAIYDKNGNGKLDTGLFRIPKEKIGYSNNAKGKLGPAKWSDTRFTVTDSDIKIDIQLENATRN